MCDCPICNMTEEEHRAWEDEYIEWEYKQYCEKTNNPLSMDDWLQSLPSPNKD